MTDAVIKQLILKGKAINNKLDKIQMVIPKDEWEIPEANIPVFQYFVSAEELVSIYKRFGGKVVHQEKPFGEAWLEIDGVVFTAMGLKEGELG